MQLAYAVATIMYAYLVGEAAGEGGYLEVVVKKLNHVLNHPRGLAEVLLFLEYVVVVLLDEGHTASRGANDNIKALK